MLHTQGSALLLVAILALPQNPTPTLTTVAPTAGRQAAAPPTGIAAARLWDQAGGMLEASSAPVLGRLYPLSDKFYVDATTGNVGIGTTSPSATLAVEGSVAFGTGGAATGVTASVLGGYGNTASATSSVIANGNSNTIGGGGHRSFIGGGTKSSIDDNGGFIGAGAFNTIPYGGCYASIAGGWLNQASKFAGSIGGGEGNVVDGDHGCVPGGFENRAGSSSLAAGYRAKAVHDGGFVWADFSEGSSGSDFSSTANNQFLIRAAGGVGIGTTTPGSQLDVAGVVRSSGPTGGSFAAYNPNQSGVSASLSWLNDVARIRIGGSGTGAQNGLDIQTVSNTSLLRIAGNGDTTAKGQMRATAFVQTSDARLKTDVRELEGALDAVLALRGVRFCWDRQQRPDAEEGERVGFLAQEVREVVPEAVRESPDGMLAVSYAELVPVLVEALQEQEAELTAQRGELARLRALQTRVLALEASTRNTH